MPTGTVEVEQMSPAPHRDSVDTISTLPVYEEMQLPLRNPSDTAALRNLDSVGQRAVSVGSIPRKPVGEGKAGGDGKGGVDGG